MTHIMIRTLVVLAIPFVMLGCTKAEEDKTITYDPLATESAQSDTAATEHETPSKQKSKKKKATAGSEKGFTIYFVQLGMFVEKENAEKLVERLQSKNYPVVLEPIPHKKHGTLHRVRLRPLVSKQAAEDAAADIKVKEGIEAFVTSTDQ